MQEFHYRLPKRTAGWRPGAHPGSSQGAGQEFVSHMRLFDRMDPRRLDLRASLRDPRGDWLVRVTRQRVGVPVMALVDISASMNFGARRTKLDVVADFLEAMGASAFRIGDPCGMTAFDDTHHEDWYQPPTLARGAGHRMSALVRNIAEDGKHATHPTRAAREHAHQAHGLAEAAMRLAGRPTLVFVISDFHWSLESFGSALDLMPQAHVVPIVVWDEAETTPPTRDGIAVLGDAEAGAHRTLWLRPRLREAWRNAVAERRAAIASFCTQRQVRPFFMQGRFNADAMSEYFLEAEA
jgi:uncharacterized protein (DUF58 family)